MRIGLFVGVLFLLNTAAVALATITQCAADRTVSASTNCTATLDDLRGEVVSSTPQAVQSVLQNPAAGTQIPIGTNVVSFTVTYTNGATDTCSAKVQVTDQSAPVILTGATNLTLIAGRTCSAALPDLTGQIVAADCSGYVVSQSPPAGTTLPVWTTNLVTFTVTDPRGLSSYCTARVAVVTLVVLPNPPTLVRSVSATRPSGSTSVSATLASVAAGHLIVVAVAGADGYPSPTSAISDNLGNRYNVASTVQTDAAGNWSVLYYASNVISGSPRITARSGSGTRLSLVAAEFSNIVLAAPLDAASGAIGSSATPMSGQMTPSRMRNLFIGAGTHATTTTTTAGTGYTMVEVATEDATTYQPLAMEYQVVDSLSPTDARFQLGSATAWAQNGAVFKVAIGAPVILAGPTNVTLGAASDCAAVLPDLTGQIAASGCGYSIGQNPAAGTVLALKTTNQVTFTVTDTNGLSSIWTAQVRVADTNPPVILAAVTNLVLTAGSNCAAVLPNLTSQVVASDCSGTSVSQSPPGGTVLALGITNVVFTVTDTNGLSSTCTAVVRVADESAPVILAGPTNLTLTAGTNCLAALPDLSGQILASDCSPYSVAQSPPPATPLSMGTNLVTLTVTDSNGLYSTWVAQVRVVDQTAPVIVAGLTNRTLSAGSNCLAVLPDLTGEILAVDCSGYRVVQSPIAGTELALGTTTTVTFTVTDTNGLARTGTAEIRVVDQTPPAILSGVTNRVLAAGSNCLAILPDLTSQIVASDCSGYSVTQSPTAGTELVLGTTTPITFTVTDTNGLASTGTAEIRVVDQSGPVILSGVTNRVLTAGSNCLAVLPDLTSQIAATDCSGYSVSQSPAAGTELPLGTNLITFTVMDTNGITSSGTAEIRVIDVSAPVILAGVTNLALGACSNSAAVLPDLTGQIVASDCSSFTVTQSPPVGTQYAMGTTNLVTFTVTDAHGYFSTWITEVRVTDQVAPVIVVGVTNFTLSAGSNCLAALPDVTGRIVATGCRSFVVTQDPPAGTELPLGTNQLTVTVADTAGLSSTSTAEVRVIDQSAPVILAATTNLTLSAGSNCLAVLPDLTGQVVASDCSGYSVTQSPVAGTGLALGTNLVALTVTDSNGLFSTWTTRVLVTDQSAPVILAGITNRTLSAGTNCLAVLPDLTGQIAATDCSGFSVTQNPPAGTVLALGSTTAVLFTVTDTNGLASTGTAEVRVADQSAPVIVSVATNLVLSAATNCLAVLPDLTGDVVASDCSGYSISQSPVAGTQLSMGTNLVTFTVTDTNGLASTRTAEVRVEDQSAPVIVTLTTNVVLAAGTNCVTTLPDLTSQVVVRDCSSYSIRQSPEAGTELALGTTNLVTFTVTDTNGLASVGTATVRVADTEPPVILAGLTNLVLSAGTNCAALLPDLTGQIVATDCSGVSVSQSPAAATELALGTTNLVTFTVTDTNGLSSTCTTQVRVTDQSPPIILAGATNLVLTGGTNCQVRLPDLAAQVVASDCSGYTVTQNPAALTELTFGSTNQVTLTVADSNGLYITSTVVVQVTDRSAPVILAGATNMTLIAGSNCTAVLEDLRGQIRAFACGGYSVVQNPASGAALALGTNLITFTVFDTNGLSSTSTTEVRVVDQSAPVIVAGPTNMTLIARGDCRALLPDLTGQVIATDCSSYVVTQSPPAGTAFGVNTTNLVTFTVTDPHGFSSTRTALIAVTTLPGLPPPPTLVQSVTAVKATGVTSVPVTMGSVAAGHLIVVAVAGAGNGPSSTSPLSDNVGNNYYVASACRTNASGNWSVLYYASNAVAGTPRITARSASTTKLSIIAAEFSNIVGVAPLDATASATGTGSTPASGAMTPSLVRNLVIGSGTHSATTVTSEGAGYTMVKIATEDAGTYQPLAMEYQVVGSVTPTDAAFQLGAATDWAQNGAVFKVIVTNLGPMILSGPTDVVLAAESSCTATLPNLTEQVVASSCGYSLAQSPVAGTKFGLGSTNTVTITLTPTNGSISTWTTQVRVVDTNAPVIVAAPTNLVLSAASNCAALLPNLTSQIVATDCSGASVSQSPPAGTALALGTTNLVTFTVADTNGLSSTCTAVVRVTDQSAPVLLAGPTNVTLIAGTNCLAALPDLRGQILASDCSGYSVSQNPPAATELTLGTNLVVLTVTDSNGLYSTWSTPVRVVDQSAPVILVGVTNRTLSPGSNCVVVVPDLTGEILASDCSGYRVTQNPIAGTQLVLGTTNLVTLTVADTNGLASTLTAEIRVVDTQAPVILSAVTNLTLSSGTNCLAVLPDLTGQVVASDCSGYSVTQSPTAGAELMAGTTNLVTLTVSDTNGLASTWGTLVSVAAPPGAETNLTISEFMAKNNTSIADENGTHADWLEIHNTGCFPVNLAGWSLTDDATRLSKWIFPSTNLAGGGYLVVWASDKDRRIPGAPLHTNFKMDDNGEYLALVQPDGVTIALQYSPKFPAQLADISYGWPADSLTNNYLAYPTPGLPNSVQTNFFIADLTFTPGSGWYTNPVSIAIQTATKGVTIYYTTNGTPPSPTNGYVYTQAVTLSKTAALRAAAYRAGYIPTAQSYTYLFPLTVAFQTGAGYPTNWGPVPALYACASNIVYSPQWSNQIPPALLSIPTLSMVLDNDDMFGTNGIYSNTMSNGNAWERTCWVEYLRPDSQPGFRTACGVKIQGNLSSEPFETPKHNFRLVFKQKYGPTQLEYDLYPGSPVQSFDTLVLHASFNDHWLTLGDQAQMQRDQWCADTQKDMGGYAAQGTFVHLFINGLYWGLYNLGERPDDSYAAHYFGGQKSDYDAFNAPNELVAGNWDTWYQMLAVANAGITNQSAYTNLCRYLDVPHFIDYLLLNFYANNLDWPDNNWRAVGSVSNGIPFYLFSWDAEITFLGVTWDRTWVNFGDVGLVYTALREYPDFLRMFADHTQQHLFNGGALTPEACAARWMKRAQEINLAMITESARWGKTTSRTYTQTDWLLEQNVLLTNWFPRRTDILLSQLRNAGLYPALDAPVFSPPGGLIPRSQAVTITAPAGVVYYTTNGSDPRLPDGTIAPDARVYASGLLFTNDVRLSARAYSTNTWSALVQADYTVGADLQFSLSQFTRLSDGSVQLSFTGTAGYTYTLHASTNLVSWVTLASLSPDAGGAFSFTDTSATNLSARFYRLTCP